MGPSDLELLKWIIGIPAAVTALLTLPFLIVRHYWQIKKLRREVQQLEDSHKKFALSMATSIGYKYRNIEQSVTLSNDGKILIHRLVEVTVSSGTLRALDHGTWVFADNKILEYSRRVKGTANGSRILDRTVQMSEKGIRFQILFDPALSGDASYEIEEELFGAIALTREEVMKQIKLGKWAFDEPYENHSFLCKFETDRHVTRAVFPATYAIGGKEFWDVTTGYTGNRESHEYQDLLKSGRIRFEDVVRNDQRILELEITKPRPGLAYWVKWIPPTRKNCAIHRLGAR